MADENKNVVIDGTATEVKDQNTAAPAPETKPEPAEKKTFQVPKWLKTVGQVIEGGAAIFGGVVGGLLIADKVTAKRRKQKYDAWKASEQIQHPTTVFEETKDF